MLHYGDYAALCCIMLDYVALCYIVLHYAVLCYIMLRYAALCCMHRDRDREIQREGREGGRDGARGLRMPGLCLPRIPQKLHKQTLMLHVLFVV